MSVLFIKQVSFGPGIKVKTNFQIAYGNWDGCTKSISHYHVKY